MLKRRHDIEDRELQYACGMIERQAVGDARAAIMATDEELLVTEVLHDTDHVAGHRRFGVWRMVARRIGSILEETHYRRATIDDKMSSQIYDRYLEFLDGQHSYFLASDITEFEQWRFRFDDMIRSGDIDPAYAIFARFQQRNRERMQQAMTLLDTEPNWTLDESFEFDRQHAAWPASDTEMNELWRKRGGSVRELLVSCHCRKYTSATPASLSTR